MIGKKVLDYLGKQKIPFEVLGHKKVFTAYDLSQTLKEDLHRIAKTLLVKADKNYVIVILPAAFKVDLAKLKKALSAKKLSIPKEEVIVKVLKVKVGGLTPFGALHKVETVADKSLLKTQHMIINAGSFTQSLRLKVKDYLRAEEAKLASFGVSAGYKPAKRAPAKKRPAAKRQKQSNKRLVKKVTKRRK